MDDAFDAPASPRDGNPLCDEGNGLVLASTNTARHRPKHVPRHTSQGYLEWKAQELTAFMIAVKSMEQELGNFTNVSHMSIEADLLTMHPREYSQSKLSQQELSDLQKATHFDKKELQQWYKGMTRPDYDRVPSAPCPLRVSSPCSGCADWLVA